MNPGTEFQEEQRVGRHVGEREHSLQCLILEKVVRLGMFSQLHVTMTCHCPATHTGGCSSLGCTLSCSHPVAEVPSSSVTYAKLKFKELEWSRELEEDYNIPGS